MRNDFHSGYLAHWGFKKGSQKKDHKYVARIGEPGHYRYFYSLKEWAAYLMENKEKLTADALNNLSNKAFKLVNDTIGSFKKNNEYATDAWDYDKQIERVKQSKEWKDIVKRKDPEYVKYDKETGNYKYDIGGYLAKKKHPGLDVMDDLVSGRKISVNKVTKKSVAAGAYDYAKSAVKPAIYVATIGSKFLLERFKLGQGTYQKDINSAINKVQETSKQVEDLSKQIEQINKTLNDPDTKKMIAEGQKVINTAKELDSIQNTLYEKTKVYENQVKDAEEKVNTAKKKVKR